jgi:hypothetical protein
VLQLVYTSGTPTHANNREPSRDIRRENTLFCEHFLTAANVYNQ